MRGEDMFKDPNTFDPERYLVPVDEETAKRLDPKNYCFGFGRRVRLVYLFCLSLAIHNTYLADLSREAPCALVSLDLDGIVSCNNGSHQGSRRERETDRTRYQVR